MDEVAARAGRAAQVDRTLRAVAEPVVGAWMSDEVGTRDRRMQCWQCGSSIRAGAKLCIYCGARLEHDDGGVGRDAPEDAYEERPGRRSARSRGDDGPPRSLSQYAAQERARTGRSRDYDERDEPARDRGEARYRPGGAEPAAGARSSRRSSPPRSSSAPDRRGPDPFADPRAPRGERPPNPTRDAHGRRRGDPGFDEYEAEYSAYDDFDPRDRKDPRYEARYDPDSAEYDAVADARRRRRSGSASRSHTQDASRDGGGRRSTRSSQEGARWRGDDYDAGDWRDEAGEDYGRYGGGAPADYRAEDDWRPAGDRGGRYAAQEAPEYYERRGGGEREAGGYGGTYDESWGMPAAGGGWGDAPSLNSASALPGGRVPGGGRAQAKGKGKGARKGGRRGGLVTVLLLIVVVVVVGATEGRQLLSRLRHPGTTGTTAPPFATYTPGPTPTPLANFKQFVSTRSQYVLNYPAAWSVNSSSDNNNGYDYVDVFAQQSPYAAVIVEQAQVFGPITDADIITAEVNGGKQNGQTYTPSSNTALTATYGGETWTLSEYNVTKGATSLHMAILACHHAGHGYAVVLVSTSADFAKQNTQFFLPLLGSFRFTS
jgi:hypothetical protein